MAPTRLQIVPAIVPEDPETVPGIVPGKGPRKKPATGSVAAATAQAKASAKRHRGVLLLPPEGWPGPVPKGSRNPNWRARYTDPETRKTKVQKLTEREAKTVDTRLAFALKKLSDIKGAKTKIVDGATPHFAADTLIEKAFSDFFHPGDKDKGIKPGAGSLMDEETQREYGTTADLFVAFCTASKIKTVRQLSKAVLHAFAVSRFGAEKSRPRKGGKRSERVLSGKRSKHTANKELRGLSSMLNSLRRADVIRLAKDDIADGLKRETADTEKGEFLKPKAIRKLIEACLKHDKAVFKITRAQKAAGKHAQPQLRYSPSLPVILFFLLTGMRKDEGELTEWKFVDLELGQIELPGRVTKTGKPRTLTIRRTSPLLQAILSQPKAGLVLADTLSRTKGRRALKPSKSSPLDALRKRLIKTYGAPHFTYNGLRRSCGTYLTCAPAIWGAASPWMSAQYLGHTVKVAETNYVGVIEIPHEHDTLETAMLLFECSKPCKQHTEEPPFTPESCPRL